MRLRKLSVTTKYILAVCVMLLVVDVVLGVLFMNQSGDSLKNLIRRHMLSVAETTAAMIDGDELAALGPDDVGSDSFLHIADTLNKIRDAQNDVDIKFIYLVKREGEHYIFTVDPDPEDPAEFGEEVVDTPGQDVAWFGDAMIDPEPVADEWGSYYTAWCPVKDSSGTTIGMVGIDFAADWYDEQMSRHSVMVLIVSCISLAVILIIMSLLTWQLQRRFRRLDSELSVLSGNVESLVQAVRERSESSEIHTEEHLEKSDPDAIRALSNKIHNTQTLLTDYMQYIQEQAFTDDMTGVGNRDAYQELVEELSRKIEEGSASFAMAICDINGLKTTNDNYGHECGDHVIIDTARIITGVFGKKNVFRIGGDEFIAVVENADEAFMADGISTIRENVDRFNREERTYPVLLSFSLGCADYRPGEDLSINEVFKRADEDMYHDKSEYYKKFGERPEHYG